MTTTEKIKAKILDLAIRGQLVAQDPADEPAAVLLARIHASRAAAEGRQSLASLSPCAAPLEPLSPCTLASQTLPPDFDAPFPLPAGWCWTRLGDVIDLISGRDLEPEDYNDQSEGLPYITGASCLSENGVLLKRWTPRPVVFAYQGDLLIVCKGAGYGKTAFCDIPKAHIARQIMAIRNSKLLNLQYLRIHLNANIQCIKRFGQGLIPGIDRNSVLSMVFPLPPLAEQKRIVAKVEALFAEVEKIGAALKRMKTTAERIDRKVLDLAIRGQLVPQDPNDEPAVALLARIHASRAAAQGKGAKGRQSLASLNPCSAPLEPLSPCPLASQTLPPDFDAPFPLPAGWCWTRLGEIAESIQYGYNAPAKSTGKAKMVRITDIQNGTIEFGAVPYCDIEDSEIPKYCLKIGDLLFARTGGTVGKSFLVESVPEKVIYAGYLIRVRCSEIVIPQYAKHFMESSLYWNQLKKGVIATAQPNCNGKKLSGMLFPLPPLAEQKRIVAKVEQIRKLVGLIV